MQGAGQRSEVQYRVVQGSDCCKVANHVEEQAPCLSGAPVSIITVSPIIREKVEQPYAEIARVFRLTLQRCAVQLCGEKQCGAVK